MSLHTETRRSNNVGAFQEHTSDRCGFNCFSFYSLKTEITSGRLLNYTCDVTWLKTDASFQDCVKRSAWQCQFLRSLIKLLFHNKTELQQTMESIYLKPYFKILKKIKVKKLANVVVLKSKQIL